MSNAEGVVGSTMSITMPVGLYERQRLSTLVMMTSGQFPLFFNVEIRIDITMRTGAKRVYILRKRSTVDLAARYSRDRSVLCRALLQGLAKNIENFSQSVNTCFTPGNCDGRTCEPVGTSK